MRFASVAAALSLIPAASAFAPPATSRASSSSSNSATTSALNARFARKGFLEGIFGDRSKTKTEETDAIAKKIETNNSLQENSKKIEGPTKEEEAANQKKLDENPNFKHMPTKDQTGVNKHIARVAATLSNQLYKIPDGVIPEFKLSTADHETVVVIDDMKGSYQPTNPPFAAVVCGVTMILGWRGTNTPTDAMSDFAWSPCSNMALGPHAKSIKLQAGMTSLASNDIVNHQDAIIAECKKRGIKKIVTTGHSLGGGIAQIAHTLLRAQMQDENSPWHDLRNLKLQTLGFSSPMTHQILEEGMSDETAHFLEELNENSCVVVYKNDVVPRCYGYGSYMTDALDDCASGLGQYLLDDKKFPFLATKSLVNKFATMLSETVATSAPVQDIVGVWSDYIHPGTIVSYKDYGSEPSTLKDYGAFHQNTGQKNTFRSDKYEPVGRKGNAVDDLVPNHFGPLYGMEYKPNKLV